jgi:predicted DNA-binding transcriptional regulator YafY
LVEYAVINVRYLNANNVSSTRDLEPFAIYSNQYDEWVLVAYCRLRKEFRSFSLTGIQEITVTNEKFTPHTMTFAEFRKKTYGN